MDCGVPVLLRVGLEPSKDEELKWVPLEVGLLEIYVMEKSQLKQEAVTRSHVKKVMFFN